MSLKNRLIYSFRNHVIAYVLLILLFVATMTLSYSLPNESIDLHIKSSVQQLNIEGQYPRPFFNVAKSQLDNFTDSWMLNIASSANNNRPFKSSLYIPYKLSNDNIKNEDKVKNLQDVLYKDDYKIKNYKIYWHGYLTFLRPLLMLFNYNGIRMLNMILLFLLFSIVVSMLNKYLSFGIMLSFAFAIITSMFIIIPMSIQFSSVFYITFISLIFMMIYHSKARRKHWLIPSFFIIGSVTCFLDLLTAPVVTLGIPLIVCVLLDQKEKIIMTDNYLGKSNFMFNLLLIIKNCILWGLGYGLTWSTKWLIASVVLKQNVVNEAIDQMFTRTSDSAFNVVITLKDLIENNFNSMYTSFILKLLLIIVIVWFVMLIFKRNKLNNIIGVIPILFVAVIPFTWYLVLKNHSFIHFWFTYRDLSVSTFAVLAFMSQCNKKYKKVLIKDFHNKFL